MDEEKEWIDWKKHTPPDDVKGIFIIYEDNFIDSDRYDHETGKRKYKDGHGIILGWKFMQRADSSRKSIQCNV